MELDCLLIYVPKLNNYYKLFGNYMFGMYMPMGLFAIADNVYQNGYKVRMLHLGIEKIENPDFFLKDYLKDAKPKVIGLALHWHFQSYDVIEIAREIKLNSPNTFIVLGGFTASYFYKEIMEEFNFVDGIIRGDGEHPFLKLTETIVSRKHDFYNIPNLTWRDKNRIIANEIDYLAGSVEINKLNFTNLNLLENYKLYIKYARLSWRWIKGLSKKANLFNLDKRNIFPLCVSRGCFVNCSFCGGSQISQKILCKRTGVVFRSVDKVIESIEEAKAYGYDTVFIECSPTEGKDFFYFEELFRKIKSKKIIINCIAECMALPSENFIKLFKESFRNISKSQISVSMDSSSEAIRKLNKGYYFSNEELIKNLSIIVNLKIPVDVYFSLGLPFDTVDILKASRDFQDLLRKNFGYAITIRTECLDLDPASPMYLDPEKYKIVKNWNHFMDYYYANSNTDNLFTNNISGYYQKDFFSESKFTSSTKPEIFKNEFEKMVCNNFCRLTDHLCARFKKRGLRLPVKIVSLLSNLICTLVNCFWKCK